MNSCAELAVVIDSNIANQRDERIKISAKQSFGKRASERVEQPICQNEIQPFAKSLKRLERVKGIEPSYSAWKAAALPLSYTRAGVELTRHAGGLNPPRAAPALLQNGPVPPGAHPVRALNRGRFAAYIDVSINNERR